MNRAAVAGQKRVIAQAVILNVRLEQLAVILDNDFRLPDEPEDTFAQHLAFPVFFLRLAEQGLNKCLNFPELFAFYAVLIQAFLDSAPEPFIFLRLIFKGIHTYFVIVRVIQHIGDAFPALHNQDKAIENRHGRDLG